MKIVVLIKTFLCHSYVIESNAKKLEHSKLLTLTLNSCTLNVLKIIEQVANVSDLKVKFLMHLIIPC